MADRTLRWYIDGNIARTKTQVGGTYKLDADYEPGDTHISCRVAASGEQGTEIDILDDGVSIFPSGAKPTLNTNDTEKTWTTIEPNTMRKGSLVTLDITEIATRDTCRDLTVELELSES